MLSGQLGSWSFAGCAVVMAAACLTAGMAHASPLPPGVAIVAPPAPGTAGGTLVAATGPILFIAPTFSGTLTSKVSVNDPANPFGPGLLTFTYQFTNLAISASSIDRMTIDGFDLAGLLIDASFQPGPGTDPTSFDRSGGATLGNTIGVGFTEAPLGLGAVLPGQASALLVLQTNSSIFNPSVASFIDGSSADNVGTFAPNAVPEPATMLMLGAGAAGLLARRKR